MCFTIDNMKSGNVQKEDMKANENKIYPARLRHITGKYKKEDFQNKIGKINNYSVKLHIYPSVALVTQTEQRIPLALRNKVNEELKRLENQVIIEDVTGVPTQWLNSLVIVPKGEHNIRICVDIRAANKAITRTRYDIPLLWSTIGL